MNIHRGASIGLTPTVMKPDSIVVNASRGSIFNKGSFNELMGLGHLGGDAMDIFEHEPYAGRLGEIECCILAAYMGFKSVERRMRMEVKVTEEAIRFIQEGVIPNQVPSAEYDVQREGL